jgi:hypothetical protein
LALFAISLQAAETRKAERVCPHSRAGGIDGFEQAKMERPLMCVVEPRSRINGTTIVMAVAIFHEFRTVDDGVEVNGKRIAVRLQHDCRSST